MTGAVGQEMENILCNPPMKKRNDFWLLALQIHKQGASLFAFIITELKVPFKEQACLLLSLLNSKFRDF
jgi:hypothetical protein